MAVPWDSPYRITEPERTAIVHSIRIFQLGESGEGSHFLKAARHYARRSGDEEYVEALRLFIAEEQGHSRALRRFMDQQDIPRARHQWTNDIFRRIRKLWNLEVCIAVLLTAEIIAKVYYRALRDATKSPVLKAICRQILKDEVDHIYFQGGMLATIRANRPSWIAMVTRWIQWLLFQGTLLIVWLDHGQCFRGGGFTFRRYWKRSQIEFRDALRIMQVAPRPAQSNRANGSQEL